MAFIQLLHGARSLHLSLYVCLSFSVFATAAAASTATARDDVNSVVSNCFSIELGRPCYQYAIVSSQQSSVFGDRHLLNGRDSFHFAT